MSELNGRWRATYTPGPWVVLSGPTLLVIMPPAAPKHSQLLHDIWSSVVAASSVHELTQTLSAVRLDSLPNFGVFFWADGQMRSLLRGSIKVRGAATGGILATGEGIQTWAEIGLGQVTHLQVDLAPTTEDVLQLPLVTGAVTASSVQLDCSDEARLIFPESDVPLSPVNREDGQNGTPHISAPLARILPPLRMPAAEPLGVPSVRPSTAPAQRVSEPYSPGPDPAFHAESAPARAHAEGPNVDGRRAHPPAQRGMSAEDTFDEPVSDAGNASDHEPARAVSQASGPQHVEASVPPPVEAERPESVGRPGVVDAEPDMRQSAGPEWMAFDREQSQPVPEIRPEVQEAEDHEMRPARPIVFDVEQVSPRSEESSPDATELMSPISATDVEEEHVLVGVPAAVGTVVGAVGVPASLFRVPAPPVPPVAQPVVRSAPEQGRWQPVGAAPQPQNPGQALFNPVQPVSALAQSSQSVGAAQSASPGGLISSIPSFGSGSRPSSTPAQPSASEHDGETIFATGIAATHKVGAANTSTPSDLVLAAMCNRQHPNPPDAHTCLRCGGLVDQTSPQLVNAPVLAVLKASTGQVEELDDTVLVGRAPSAQPTDADPALMTVPSPSQDISRTHLRFSAKQWQIVVTDLHSTNGSVLIRRGEEPVRLLPGEPTAAEIGAVVDLGDGVSILIDQPQ